MFLIFGQSNALQYLLQSRFLVPSNIHTINIYKPLNNFRTTNHPLPIETGKWYGIPVNDRNCTLCNIGKLSDEFHVILYWKSLSILQKQFLHTRYKPSTMTFTELLTTANLKH